MNSFPKKLARALVLVVVATAVAPTALAEFYQARSSDSARVWLSSDRTVAFTTQSSNERLKLVSFDPATGRRLGQVAIPKEPGELKSVRVDGAERLVAVYQDRVTLNASIVDVARDGSLRTRADVSLAEIPYQYTADTLLVASNGAFYVRLFGPGPRDMSYVVYDLDNGQRLGAIPLENYNGFATLLDGPAPKIVYASLFYSSWLVLVDASDPASAGTSVQEKVLFPGARPLAPQIGDSDSSGDRRYLFLADVENGLWAFDTVAGQFVGSLHEPDAFRQVKVREAGGRRTLLLTTFEPSTYEQPAMLLVDADDPAEMRVLSSRQSPDGFPFVEPSEDGNQFWVATATGVQGLDAETLETLWSVAAPGLYGVIPQRIVGPQGGSNALFAAWRAETAGRLVAASLRVASVTAAELKRRSLVVYGSQFDERSKILVDGVERKTVAAGGKLTAKNALAGLAPGSTVRVQVRDASGTVSSRFQVVVP